VSGRENKAIATNPTVIAWVVAQFLLEQQVGGWRQANSGSGVAVSNLFDCVCGQYLRGLYRLVINFIPVQQGDSNLELFANN
jgi:hypothetical protein